MEIGYSFIRIHRERSACRNADRRSNILSTGVGERLVHRSVTRRPPPLKDLSTETVVADIQWRVSNGDEKRGVPGLQKPWHALPKTILDCLESCANQD